MTTAIQELETLPVSERVQLVEDLWDSIARSNADIPIPQWQKDELDRRKQNYLRNPVHGLFFSGLRMTLKDKSGRHDECQLRVCQNGDLFENSAAIAAYLNKHIQPIAGKPGSG